MRQSEPRTTNAPIPPDKNASIQLRRQMRAAMDRGRKLAETIRGQPLLRPLVENAEAKRPLDQMEQDLAVLVAAPKSRIGAARRLQGSTSRRQTAAQGLFESCAEIRRRVRVRYRGPRYAALRRAFGEGLPASPSKPRTVLAFATMILNAAATYPAEVREVRVRAPTLQRLKTLLESLKSWRAEQLELRTARRQNLKRLRQVTERVEQLCQSLIDLVARLCPPEAQAILNQALRPRVPRSRGREPPVPS